MGRWQADWPGAAHLIGIAGSAMSGLATMLAARGLRVTGSDEAVYPPASDVLAAAGITVATPYAAGNLPAARDALVVVGNAISRGHPELERALDEDRPLASMAEVVERLLVPGRRVTAVAGTHGKTTTASLLAHLHAAAGRRPSFLIGGKPGNFASGAHLDEGEDLLLEADEYDTAFFDKGPKFLHYWPRIAVLGPVEFDHADIYADEAAVERAFALLIRLVPPSGTLVVHSGEPLSARLAEGARCRVVTAGVEPGCTLRAVGREDREGDQFFRLERDGRAAGEVILPLPGEHNARNALAALLAAEAAGLPLERAAPLLSRFRPPRRRLEIVGRGPRGTVYDDFAHHPTAIGRTLATLREGLAPGGRLIACLEPRSNTMVRALVQAPLAEALAGADVVFVGPVHRAERFAEGERLDVAALVAELERRGRVAEGPLPPERIAERVGETATAADRIVVMSNGGFGGLPARLGELAGTSR
jgi:UDP-N-acetylmuramate: L-alanyl-gamma-D-glutamyl-meso-diaminopimelate ligase